MRSSEARASGEEGESTWLRVEEATESRVREGRLERERVRREGGSPRVVGGMALMQRPHDWALP